MKILLTPTLARAAAHDAATRQMRAKGRTSWSRSDYSLACRVLRDLMRRIKG